MAAAVGLRAGSLSPACRHALMTAAFWFLFATLLSPLLLTCCSAVPRACVRGCSGGFLEKRSCEQDEPVACSAGPCLGVACETGNPSGLMEEGELGFFFFFCSCLWKAGPHGCRPVRVRCEGALRTAHRLQVSAALVL